VPTDKKAVKFPFLTGDVDVAFYDELEEITESDPELDEFEVPVLAYQVSGEYAMIASAAEHGILDREAAMIESLADPGSDRNPQRLDAAMYMPRRVFDQVSLFVAPSRSIAEEFIALGLPSSKVRVADLGFPETVSPGPARNGGPLRIGFVGTLTWHKGPHVLIEAARRLPAAAYDVQLHGNPHVFPDYAADLQRRADGLPIRFMGGFTAAQTASVYGGFDVLTVPSLWLENSPLVVHEAFQAGVPVVGSRIGGTADLVTDGVNGRLYDPSSPGELAAILQSLIDRPNLLAEWRRALPAVKTLEDDAREWEQIYAEVVAV